MLFTKFKSKQNPHYTSGIAPQRVTSGGPIFAAWRLGNTAPTKSRSGGEPLLLATLRRAVGDTVSYLTDRKSNARTTAPISIAMSALSTL